MKRAPTNAEREGNGKVYIGLDPGMHGAIAAINGVIIQTTKMPATDADLWQVVSSFTRRHDVNNLFAVIEKVGGYIGKPQPGDHQFKFGASYGRLLMALTAAGIPFEEVRPQRWQKGLEIPPRKPHTKTRQVQIKRGKRKGEWRTERYGGETDTEFKARLKQRAQRLFPQCASSLTLDTCDALLIAEYAKRKQEGKL